MNIPPTLSPTPFVPCPRVDTAVRDAHGHLVAYFYGDHGHMNRELFLALANGAEAAIETVRSDIEDQEGAIEALKDELADTEDERDEIQADLADARSDIRDLKEQVKGLETERRERDDMIAALQRTLDSLRSVV